MSSSFVKLALIILFSTLELSVPAILSERTIQEPRAVSSLAGKWDSVLQIGDTRLRLVLKVVDSGSGKYKASLDSLDQANSTDLTVDIITLDISSVHFEMRALQVTYDGNLSSDGTEISGTFTQAGHSFPLLFRKQNVAQLPATVKRGRVQFNLCNQPSLSRDALCGKYEVFENRTTKSGRKIPLNVVLLPASNSKPAPDPLFYLAGGPGGAATGYASESFMAGLRRNRDIVLVDQRGTGASNPLNCSLGGSRDDMRGFFGEQFPLERVRSCRVELEKVADLTLYTTSIAMDDLDEIREALGYDQINVYGGSYGSTASLVYLRQHPEHVRTVALFGVAPPSAKIPLSFSRGIQDAMDRLLADCAADKACNEAYPDVRGDFNKILAHFEKGPIEVSATNIYTGSTQKVLVTRDSFVDGVRQLLYVPAASAALPGLIHVGASGDLGPLVGTSFQVLAQISSRISRGMQLSVICSEGVPFITPEEVKTTSKNSFYGDARVRPMMNACAEWPRAKVPASFPDPVKSDKPVLLVSGALDPVTPPWLAESAIKTLSNSRLIVPKNATHTSYQCIDRLIADFIDLGTTKGLDVSCVDQIRRPPFTIIRK